MKTMMVLRHATAEKNGPDGRDYTRPLTPAGREEARAQGQRMRGDGLVPALVATSAAVRAVETAQGACEAFSPMPPVWTLETLYNASGHELLAALQELPEPSATVLLVAHMPGVAELVYLLLKPTQSPTLNYVPGTYAVMELNISRWVDIAPAKGVLRNLCLPGA